MNIEFKLPADNRIPVMVAGGDGDIVGKFVRFECVSFCRVCDSRDNPHAVVREIRPVNTVEAASGHIHAVVSWLSSESYPAVMGVLNCLMAEAVKKETLDKSFRDNLFADARVSETKFTGKSLPKAKGSIVDRVSETKFTGKSLPKAKGSIVDRLLVSNNPIRYNITGRMVKNAQVPGEFVICSNPHEGVAYIIGTYPQRHNIFFDRFQAKVVLRKISPGTSIDCEIRYNTSKVPLNFMFTALNALKGMSRVLEFGANKYARDNWKKGSPYTELVDSLCRHLLGFMSGEDMDADSGLPHVDHLLCNALFLSELTRTQSEFDDRGGVCDDGR